jgi:glycosyltransferase involved in cell wall biosynthesis
MKIVALGLSKNEADVIQETVRRALQWVNAYVLYDSSTDGTGDLAREAGATVVRGDPNEAFSEALRNHALDVVHDHNPDWVVRIDVDEIYPYRPRRVIETAVALGATAVRATVFQFWLTLADLRSGALLEDPTESVVSRRRWYSVGNTAVVAWKHDPALRFCESDDPTKAGRNVPLDAGRRGPGQRGRVATPHIFQFHYPFRSLPQLVARCQDRARDRRSFGKYTENVIVDEVECGLYYLDRDGLQFTPNNHKIKPYYEASRARLATRRGAVTLLSELPTGRDAR